MKLLHFKTLVFTLLALALTSASFIFTPLVDSIQLENSEQYPFFYANTLPLVYYIAIVYSALLAVFCKKDSVKLISLLCVALLVELTPSLMLVNPWLPDQYPYLAEPVYLVMNSHIAPVHYLHEVPGLGLMFSQLMLVADLGPYVVSKIYPFLTVLMLVLPTFLLSKEICENGAIAPLLFLAVNSAQINTFHRFSFFFMLFSLAIFLAWRINRKLKPTYVILFAAAFSTATLTYPGSILIPSILLPAPLIWLILEKFRSTLLSRGPKQLSTIYRLGLISMIIFLSWGIFVSSAEFARLIKQIYGAFVELASPEDPFRILTPQHGFARVTPTTIFLYILRIRMVLSIVLQGLGFLSTILLLHGKGDGGTLTHMLYLPLLITYLLFLPTSFNQWYTVRAVLYATFLASLCIASLWHLKQNKTLKITIMIFIVVGLTLVPVTRYASIPYLHPTTQELVAAAFVHCCYVDNQRIYYTEYPPYVRVIVGKDPGWELTQIFLTSEQDLDINSNILMSKRYLARDGYYLFPKPANVTFNYAMEVLSSAHNIVYVNGYVDLFMKG